MARTPTQTLLAAFKKFDLNGDGSISTDEFHKSMDILGWSVNKRERQAMLKVLDKDNDGFVQVDEFLNGLAPKGDPIYDPFEVGRERSIQALTEIELSDVPYPGQQRPNYEPVDARLHKLPAVKTSTPRGGQESKSESKMPSSPAAADAMDGDERWRLRKMQRDHSRRQRAALSRRGANAESRQADNWMRWGGGRKTPEPAERHNAKVQTRRFGLFNTQRGRKAGVKYAATREKTDALFSEVQAGIPKPVGRRDALNAQQVDSESRLGFSASAGMLGLSASHCTSEDRFRTSTGGAYGPGAKPFDLGNSQKHARQAGVAKRKERSRLQLNQIRDNAEARDQIKANKDFSRFQAKAVQVKKHFQYVEAAEEQGGAAGGRRQRNVCLEFHDSYQKRKAQQVAKEKTQGGAGQARKSHFWGVG